MNRKHNPQPVELPPCKYTGNKREQRRQREAQARRVRDSR